MATKLQIRRDISTNWTVTNPEILPGEICFESDTGKIKIGKVSGELWNDIAYIMSSDASHIHNITDISNFNSNVESVIMNFLVNSTDIDVVYNAVTDKIQFKFLSNSITSHATNLSGGVLGALVYQSALDTTTFLAGNTSTNKLFLSQTGTGTISSLPSWSSLTKDDVGLSNVENTALSTELSSYSLLGHNHTSSNITNLVNTIQSEFTSSLALDKVISGLWKFNQLTYIRIDLGSSLTGDINLNLNNANYFTGTVSGNITLSFSIVSTGSLINKFTLILTNGGNFTITWPVSIKWSSGIAPVLTSSGKDILSFTSDDNGVTWLNTEKILDLK